MKIYFDINSFALSLTLKQRLEVFRNSQLTLILSMDINNFYKRTKIVCAF